MFKKYLKIGALAAAATLAFMSQQAQAVTFNCTFGTQSGGADVWDSTGCVGLSGNASEGAVAGLFGQANWTLDSKWDTGSYSPSGILTVGGSGLAGTWSVSSWAGIMAAMLVIKASNGFVGYSLDLTAGLSGGWTTNGIMNGGGRQPGISNIGLYVVPVPLPAAGILLVSAIGGLGLFGRKRRKA